MPIEKEKLGLILIGAQSFPESKNFGSSEAFYNSYNKIKGFFFDTSCVGLSSENILDLFDSDLGPDKQDVLIAEYIEQQRKAKGITDIIIYYIGHGGYARLNGGYILAIKSTRDKNLGVSSITMKSLAVTISKFAKDLRIFIILDCCFAGDALKDLQSPVDEVLRKTLEDGFPSRGIALFCSSPSDEPSVIIKERKITMFTEGLEKALRVGNFQINNRFLTLRQLQQLTHQYIKDLNPGESIRPEVHTPKQSDGDIADTPYFPNLGFKINGYDILMRRKILETKIIENDLAGVVAFFMDFVNDFDLKKKYEIDVVLIASDCNELTHDLTKMEQREEQDDEKKDRFRNKRRELYKKVLSIVSDLSNNQVIS